LNGNSGGLSICALADCLECTEKDILRAFKYWSKVGLLHIDYDEAGNICGLAVGNSDTTAKTETHPVIQSEPVSPKPSVQKKSKKTLSSNQDELRQLYFMTEQYMGKPLTANEIKKINYFFDSLDFSVDLIEYLIEYCVENGHRNMKYIETVALAWSDAGIQTTEDAKMNTTLYTKNVYSILNAFGIKGRSAAPAEISYIKKWSDEYGFSLDIILEACNRTINNTHKPDFKYADSILSNWLKKNVQHLKDISVLDEAFRQGKETKKRNTTKAVTTANRFNNFEGRSYDINSLEQQLLNSN
jgi:DnaD/phage-associated family protein